MYSFLYIKTLHVDHTSNARTTHAQRTHNARITHAQQTHNLRPTRTERTQKTCPKNAKYTHEARTYYTLYRLRNREIKPVMRLQILPNAEGRCGIDLPALLVT